MIVRSHHDVLKSPLWLARWCATMVACLYVSCATARGEDLRQQYIEELTKLKADNEEGHQGLAAGYRDCRANYPIDGEGATHSSLAMYFACRSDVSRQIATTYTHWTFDFHLIQTRDAYLKAVTEVWLQGGTTESEAASYMALANDQFEAQKREHWARVQEWGDHIVQNVELQDLKKRQETYALLGALGAIQRGGQPDFHTVVIGKQTYTCYEISQITYCDK